MSARFILAFCKGRLSFLLLLGPKLGKWTDVVVKNYSDHYIDMQVEKAAVIAQADFSSSHKAIIYILSERKHMLKLQYFGHLMWRTDSLEKILMLKKLKAGGEGDDDRGWDDWMASLIL